MVGFCVWLFDNRMNDMMHHDAICHSLRSYFMLSFAYGTSLRFCASPIRLLTRAMHLSWSSYAHQKQRFQDQAHGPESKVTSYINEKGDICKGA